jgi:hypothetical protein
MDGGLMTYVAYKLPELVEAAAGRILDLIACARLATRYYSSTKTSANMVRCMFATNFDHALAIRHSCVPVAGSPMLLRKSTS